MGEDKFLQTLHIILFAVIMGVVVFVAAIAIFISSGVSKLVKAQEGNVVNPYAPYGVSVPESFTRIFRYESESGIQGDKCTAEGYKTAGDISLFSSFTDDPGETAEQLLDFVLDSAGVPKESRPNYSQSYKWNILENDDDRLVVIYFPEEEVAYWGSAVV